MHPYIGMIFRVRRSPFTGESAGKNDIPSAVCVAIGPAGSSVSEGEYAFVAAYLRLPDGSHIEVELRNLVGPLESA